MDKEKKWCVYKHTNKANGKVYIGQTCKNPKRRWRGGSGYKSCVYFYNAIEKYGWDSFEHEILYSNLTIEEANQIEQELISQYNSTDPKFGYNLMTGGGNGSPNETVRQKMRKAQSKENNGMWGKKHTAEARIKMSQSHADVSGKNNPRWGKEVSEETRQKISRANSGKNNYGYGKPLSEERRKKTSRAVICIETGIVYFGAREAERNTGCLHSGIVQCCKGNQVTCGGYHWKYADEIED